MSALERIGLGGAWAVPSVTKSWRVTAHYMHRIGGSDGAFGYPKRDDFRTNCGLEISAQPDSPLLAPGNFPHCKRCEASLHREAGL